MKYLRQSLFAASLIIACFTGYAFTNRTSNKNAQYVNYVCREDSQNKWIKILNDKNPELHDAIIGAMLLSKDTGKEIFVLRKSEGKLKYAISVIRGNAENILSYDYKTRYLSFDHDSEDDGPSLQTAENILVIEKKIDSYYKELNIK